MKDFTPSRDRLVREYLAVCGATAICVMQEKHGCVLRVGRNVAHMPGVISAQWLDQKIAADVARTARRNAGRNPIKATVERELHKAAALHKVALTTDIVVVSRATFAAKKLAEHLDAMDRKGDLALFKREYRRRRIAAGLRGEGFVSYANAMVRLRRMMIRMLIDKKQIELLPSFLNVVFGREYI